MKKLLVILSAVTLITASATTVVACSPNINIQSEDDFINSIENQIEREAYIATSDITKSILLSRSENLSINQENNFENNSKGMSVLPKFKNSKKNDGTRYGNRFSEHYNTWNNIFTSNFSDNKISSDVKNFSDFIWEDSLKINIENNSKGKKAYSLIDQENLLPFMMSNYDLNNLDHNATPNFHLKDLEVAIEEEQNDNLEFNLNIWQNLIASGMQDIGNIVQNLDGTKIQAVFGVIGNLFAISKTNGGVINPDDSSKGVGGLKNLWMGHKDFPPIAMMFTWRTAKATYEYPGIFEKNKGDRVGALTALYEKMWIELVKNKDILIKQMGIELYEYVVGKEIDYYKDDTSKPYLINEVYEGAAYKIVDGKNDQNNVAMKSKNNGLYGQLINSIGKVKKYNKSNVDAKIVKSYDNMSYNRSEYHGIEDSVIDVLKLNVELFNITSSLINRDTLTTIIDKGMSTFTPLLIMLSGMLGINISDKLLISNFAIQFLEWYLDFETDKEINKKTSISEIKEIFNNSFKLATINELRKAKPYSINETNWFSDNNTEYRNNVFRALGYDEKEGFIEGKLFYNLRETLKKEEYQNLFKGSDISKYIKNIDNIINKNIIDNNIWKPSNYNVKYKQSIAGINVVEDITYTLEYNGMGYNEISNFKASDDLKNKNVNDILNIMAEDSNSYNLDIKNKINGKGNIDDLANVKHRYLIKWTNVSSDPTKIDMKLVAISKPEVYTNGSWIKMKI